MPCTRAAPLCESLRPDIITVTADGQAVLNDLGDLLPMPLPASTQIRATLYTAPELVLTPDKADGRADLYGFGAMLYALEYLHHGLEEKDFETAVLPKADHRPLSGRASRLFPPDQQDFQPGSEQPLPDRRGGPRRQDRRSSS